MNNLDKEFNDLEDKYEHSVNNLLFITQKINEMAKNKQVDDLINICKQLDNYISGVIDSREQKLNYIKCQKILKE